MKNGNQSLTMNRPDYVGKAKVGKTNKNVSSVDFFYCNYFVYIQSLVVMSYSLGANTFALNKMRRKQNR